MCLKNNKIFYAKLKKKNNCAIYPLTIDLFEYNLLIKSYRFKTMRNSLIISKLNLSLTIIFNKKHRIYV